MALSFGDRDIDRLAERAQKILKAPSKTEAIRQALERVVGDEAEGEPVRSEQSARDRIKDLQDEVKRLGTPNPNFDGKAFLDEMWES